MKSNYFDCSNDLGRLLSCTRNLSIFWKLINHFLLVLWTLTLGGHQVSFNLDLVLGNDLQLDGFWDSWWRPVVSIWLVFRLFFLDILNLLLRTISRCFVGFICISGSEILLTLLFLNQIAHLIRCLHFGNFVFYHFCSCDIVSLIFLQSLCFFRLIVDHLLFLRFILVNTICQNLGVFCQKLCILFALLNILLTKDSSLLSLLLHKKVFLLIKTNLDV